MAVVEFNNVTFSYPGQEEILADINWVLNRGDKVGFFGPVGSGKSTFLKLIVGLLNPLQGEIQVFGEPRSREKDFYPVRRQTGFLFENPDYQLFNPTVFDEVSFAPRNYGFDSRQAREMAAETLAELEIEHLRTKPPYELSSGEKKLVALASIVVMKPRLLLLDEPVSGLDEQTRARFEKIIDCPEISAIIVSHNHQWLRNHTDRICRGFFT